RHTRRPRDWSSDVCSSDLVACRKSRAELPSLHQEREIPGNDLPDHPDWFMPGVAEIIAGDGYGLALNLVRPTGVVTITTDGQRQVGSLGNVIGLAVVERFELSQLVGVLLNQVG